MNPAIVIVAYNRPETMLRLLNSIKNARFDTKGIPLIISIDGGGLPEVIQLSEEFEWAYGEKVVIRHQANMGLKDHIIACGDLSEKFGAIIILEDDIMVSPEFYAYTVSALDYFGNDDDVAGIALYAYAYSETAQLPFQPLYDGYDNYFMQVPCSWGQAWTAYQWRQFREYPENALQISEEDPLPNVVKAWSHNSWKKLFFKYLMLTSKFFVYPHLSLTTNFADVGVNSTKQYNYFQVRLMQKKKGPWNFTRTDETISLYDSFFELIIRGNTRALLPEFIDENAIIDTYGTKPLDLFDGKMALSVKPCKAPVRSFDVSLIPLINNVFYNITGDSLYLSYKGDFMIMTEQDKIEFAGKICALGFNYGTLKIKRNLKYRIGHSLLFPFIMIYRTLKR